MNPASILILAVIAVWFVISVIHSVRKKGCSCSDCVGNCRYCEKKAGYGNENRKRAAKNTTK